MHNNPLSREKGQHLNVVSFNLLLFPFSFYPYVLYTVTHLRIKISYVTICAILSHNITNTKINQYENIPINAIKTESC